MPKFKVVLLEDRYETHDHERRVLQEIDAEVIEAGHTASEDEVIDICRDADGITVNLAEISARVIQGLEKCRVIGRYGVGYDNVDIGAASAKGIKVVNVPDYCDEDVSDHAMALFLGCVRKISIRDRQVRAGQWNIGPSDPVYRVKGKTFGLVGYGRIPQTLHRKLKGFDLGRVLVADPFISEEFVAGNGAELVEFNTLVKNSDFISIHAPLTDKTHGMFGEDQFRAMKDTAILINTARGPIVDPDALYKALKNGWINSAGIDVHTQEPLPKDSKFFELDNVILTDHTGFYTEESQIELQTKCARNLATVLKGEDCDAVVNR